MWFVLAIILIVIAGWIYMASTASAGTTARDRTIGTDDYVPVNAYDNPYDTNENNDRPFEPDNGDDASDAFASDGSDSSDTSSD